jgi:hypothetical protein
VYSYPYQHLAILQLQPPQLLLLGPLVMLLLLVVVLGPV